MLDHRSDGEPVLSSLIKDVDKRLNLGKTVRSRKGKKARIDFCKIQIGSMKIFCNVKFGMSNNDNDNNKAG